MAAPLWGRGMRRREGLSTRKIKKNPGDPSFDLLATRRHDPQPLNLALDSRIQEGFCAWRFRRSTKRHCAERHDLLRFDMHSHEFRPFLPGIAATDVDFSRDGRLIAYVRRPDQTFWISQSDGTAARKIELQRTIRIAEMVS